MVQTTVGRPELLPEVHLVLFRELASSVGYVHRRLRRLTSAEGTQPSVLSYQLHIKP
jgi:hypothetical protein